MMNDVDIKLVGDKELLLAFRELDNKTQHKRLHQVLSNVGNIPQKAMKAVIPIRKDKRNQIGEKWHPPGAGKKSITKKRGRSRQSAVLFIGPRTRTGNYETDAYYLKFWEYFRPGRKLVTHAIEQSKPRTQMEIYNSMRTIVIRAWNKYVKR